MQTTRSLISIILPIYNAELYLREAIESVLQQSYSNWELLAINDGSTDCSEQIVKSYNDPRIHYFSQKNKGVSAARNVGLRNMKGDYFCFLDSDDVLPKNSIRSRANLLDNNLNVSFVDGKVISKNENLSSTLSTYVPSYRGNPLKELIRLTNSCFLGNTWMVRADSTQRYLFNEGITHAEDLSFYLSISTKGNYDYVEEEILWYRRNRNSAMSNLRGLEKGYSDIYKLTKSMSMITVNDLRYLKKRIMRIMFLSWLFDGRKPLQAFLSLIRIGTL